jgi:norsolorinic acid ketoreductase
MLSSRPETIVLAGVRSIPLPPDSDLARIVERCPQNVLPLKLTSADAADNQEAAQYIQERWGKVDVIIANAGK